MIQLCKYEDSAQTQHQTQHYLIVAVVLRSASGGSLFLRGVDCGDSLHFLMGRRMPQILVFVSVSDPRRVAAAWSWTTNANETPSRAIFLQSHNANKMSLSNLRPTARTTKVLLLISNAIPPIR
jgi:hypothetical protein